MGKYIVQHLLGGLSTLGWHDIAIYETKKEAVEALKELMKKGADPSDLRVVKTVAEYVPALKVTEDED